MIKRKLKWAIVPVLTAIAFAGFSSFADDSETPVDSSMCNACTIWPNYNCEFSGVDENGNHTIIICLNKRGSGGN
jgi:hypothetical protein